MNERRGRKPPAPLTPETARGRALRALGRREHSARELKSKLTHEGLDLPSASEVVDELGEAGWQSDERYAGLLTRARISQGYGPLRIRAELLARGIGEALIRAAIEEAAPDWPEIVARVYGRRYSTPPTTRKEQSSRYRFLAARGFTSGQIRSVVDAIADDGDAMDFDEEI